MWTRLLCAVTCAVTVGLAAPGCGDDISSETCRFEPAECDGGAGALCRDDRDCLDGLFCCTEDKNCGGGMCTAGCDSDRDCPPDMLCEHDKCFYACASDRDCAIGMSCEHGNTICEYP